MKKIFAIILTIIMLSTFALSMSAEGGEPLVESETVMETVEEAVEDTESQTDIIESPETHVEAIDSEKYAQQFIDYVFSGAAGSGELMDKIIAMGEQFAEQKEAGYTFKERINQLITPENMITTISAAFLLICGIAMFIFKRWQKRSNMSLHNDITYLRKKYDKETEENKKLKEEVEELRSETKELHELIQSLCERSDLSKSDMEHISHTATAVAKMVKDVFLNSRTIDASGKSLLVHNYLEALGEEADVKQ
jgi:cell division protein FtsL